MTDEKPVSLRDQLRAELQGWLEDLDSPEHVSLIRLDGLTDQLFDLVAAGADFTSPEDGTELTPAQALAFLLDADPPTRLTQLAGLLDSARSGATCRLMDHQGRIGQLQEELATIPLAERRRAQLNLEAERFVQARHLHLDADQWALLRASIDQEIERTR